ncbi:glycosyltransferase family 9 protein [Ramlibacter sp.]|uniref:glycosyltransferase family 9 protein n=1 Tax=Ramlibacter sp. TaxID=1917967 RepID=UPI0035B44667
MQAILVVITRQIGDVLLTTPLVRAARALWPGAAIDVLGLEGTLGMLAGHPDLRQCITVPARTGVAQAAHLARRLWQRYDLALVADPGDRAHLIGAIAARERSGLLPATSGSNWWKRRLLRHAVTSGGDLSEVHVVREKLALLAPWQGDAPPQPPALQAPAREPLPDELRAQLAKGYIVIHAPSMWTYKQWPLDHFAELIGLLTLAGRQVVLTGGPGASDRLAVAALTNAAASGQVLDAGVLRFGQVAALIAGAALYIGPDTSVSHLAAACGVPVLAIFGPTNPQRWAPWPGEAAGPTVFARQATVQTLGRITLMQAALPCVPCGKAGCEDHRESRSDCLLTIRPERVAQQALALLAAQGTSAPR